MSREAFRFVHATCLCLDEPLSGTGPLSAEDRELVEDATFLAWEEIVETCIGAQVEFLILTGNSFYARSQSLRSRVALSKGFERLAANHIAVYVAPGSHDPASAWRKQFLLPPNVTLLSDEEQEPVAVMRDQQVLASVYIVAGPHSDETKWSESGPTVLGRHQAPFRIGIVPAGTPLRWEKGRPVPLDDLSLARAAATLVKEAISDKTEYIGLGQGNPRTEHYPGGIAHDPGCAQSLDGSVTGSRGCSVVNVPSSGPATIDSVAVAPIRWESISLKLEASHNWDDLIERMVLTVMDRVADNDERLWIIHWRLSGEGPVFEALAASNAQRELWDLVEAELTGETDVRRVHRLQSVENFGPVAINRSAPTGLLKNLTEMLETLSDEELTRVREDVLGHESFENPQWQLAKEFLQRAPRHRVERRCRELAAQWLD